MKTENLILSLEAHNRFINLHDKPINFGDFMYCVFKGATFILVKKALEALKCK